MIIRSLRIFIVVIVFITSCTVQAQLPEEATATKAVPQFDYRIGLGYGFVGKLVQVAINGHEVLSIYGTNEIEQYAQLRGTKMLASGSWQVKDITIQVTVDGGQAQVQAIDLSDGMFIHIYQEQIGLRIYNTPFLVEE